MKTASIKLDSETDSGNEFLRAFRGRFIGIIEWKQLDEFWRNFKGHTNEGWYIYAVGEDVPTKPGENIQVVGFIHEIDVLLRREHQEDYCGIVYTDSKTAPSIIKIFDPNNLGVVCGFSDNPPLPGWVMSKIPPVALDENTFLPANRRRWWRNLWKKAS